MKTTKFIWTRDGMIPHIQGTYVRASDCNSHEALVEAVREIHKLWCCPAPKRIADWSARCDIMADVARKALALAEGQQ